VRGGSGPEGGRPGRRVPGHRGGRRAPAPPREGELALVTFRDPQRHPEQHRPSGPHPAPGSDADGSTSSVVTWQFSPPGLVTYAPERDEWTYDKGRRPDVRRPVFNSGLVVPGETLVLRARVRLLEMPMDFQFSYFELTAEEIRRKVYFEFREAKLVRYRTLVGRELLDRLTPSLRTDEDGHRIVVFPPRRADRLEHPAQDVPAPAAPPPRYFTLEQAARKAGVSKPRPGDYSFCTILDAWILPKDQGHVLVTPTAVQPLPELRQMERIFHFVDTIVPEKITVEVRKPSVASALSELKYRMVKDEKEVLVGITAKEKRVLYYLYLTAEQFPKFLFDLHSLKLPLDIEYREGGGCLLVHNK
jgi:hypothetical protein